MNHTVTSLFCKECISLLLSIVICLSQVTVHYSLGLKKVAIGRNKGSPLYTSQSATALIYLLIFYCLAACLHSRDILHGVSNPVIHHYSSFSVLVLIQPFLKLLFLVIEDCPVYCDLHIAEMFRGDA